MFSVDVLPLLRNVLSSFGVCLWLECLVLSPFGVCWWLEFLVLTPCVKCCRCLACVGGLSV